MAKFRKKPVVIDAVQFTGNFDEAEAFVGGDAEFRNGELIIATLEGPLHASPGDWIIKGIKGEFYPCKPDVFEKTYEPVEQAKPARDPLTGRPVCPECRTTEGVHGGCNCGYLAANIPSAAKP